MGEMTGEIWERYVRDFWHLSHVLSPLYKGVSDEKVRDGAKTSHHVAEPNNRTNFAIWTWQNRGYVYKDIYLRVVKMPCTIVKDA